MDQTIGVHFAKFTTAKEIWDYLSRLYVQSNFAKRYQLGHEIGATSQENKSIREFHSVITGLWDQLKFTEPKELSTNSVYCTYREKQRLVQFLMALRDDFEGISGTILHQTPLPSVDSVVNELLAEEIHFRLYQGRGYFFLYLVRQYYPHLSVIKSTYKATCLFIHFWMSAAFVIKKVNGRHNAPNWSSKLWPTTVFEERGQGNWTTTILEEARGQAHNHYCNTCVG